MTVTCGTVAIVYFSRAGDMAQFFAGKETVAVFVMRPPQSQAWYSVIAENENRREALVAEQRN